MRAKADVAKIRELMRKLGEGSRGPGCIYLTGGATALLEGWRATTVDVDLKLDPEPPGAFEAIAQLKNELDVNVELAAPDQFLPAVPGWRERSRFIDRYGSVDFYHYDFVSQALSKVARAHDRDLRDIEAMISRGLVRKEQVREAFKAIEADLPRYPGVDAQALCERVDRLMSDRLTGDPDG